MSVTGSITKNYCTEGEAARGETPPPLKEGHDEGQTWGKFLSLQNLGGKA